jgi:hypothetical protein
MTVFLSGAVRLMRSFRVSRAQTARPCCPHLPGVGTELDSNSFRTVGGDGCEKYSWDSFGAPEQK